MRKLFLLGFIAFFGVKYCFGEEQKLETKKLGKVEAVTTATPTPQENQFVVTGTLICTSCELKKQKGAKSQCSVYGCSYAIKTKNVRNNRGQLVRKYLWKTFHILENDNSAALLQKGYKDKDVIIVGKIYPEENVLEVDFVKLAPVKKIYTCSMCGGEFDKPGKCPKCNMDLIEKH
jgi:ribosomal protein L37AE/L43A